MLCLAIELQVGVSGGSTAAMRFTTVSVCSSATNFAPDRCERFELARCFPRSDMDGCDPSSAEAFCLHLAAAAKASLSANCCPAALCHRERVSVAFCAVLSSQQTKTSVVKPGPEDASPTEGWRVDLGTRTNKRSAVDSAVCSKFQQARNSVDLQCDWGELTVLPTARKGYDLEKALVYPLKLVMT